MMDNVQAAASAASSPYLETIKTWIIYAGVLIGAVITAWAGVRKAYRDLKKAERKEGPHPATTGIIGGSIMENQTLLMWSESNRSVVEALEGLVEKVDTLTRATNYNTDAVRDQCKEAAELRHQTERLRDKLP